MIVEFWVIYHASLGSWSREKLTKPENYYDKMTRIGPAFGASFLTTPRFASKMEAGEVTRQFSPLVMDELQHCAEVSGEDRRFKPWVAAYYKEIDDEAQEEENGQRAQVREPQPGRGLQLDPRGQGAQGLEEEAGTGGAPGGRDRPKVPRQEAIPGTEGDRDRGVKIQFHKLDPSGGLPPVPETAQEQHRSILDMAYGRGARTPEEEADGKRYYDYINREPVKVIKTKHAEIPFYAQPLDDDAGACEHTQDPDGDWPRVGGDCVCELCGQTFYKHPLDGPEGWDGKFLNRLCDGRLVKL